MIGDIKSIVALIIRITEVEQDCEASEWKE